MPFVEDMLKLSEKILDSVFPGGISILLIIFNLIKHAGPPKSEVSSCRPRKQVTVPLELAPTESPCSSPETPTTRHAHRWMDALHFKSSGASDVFSFAFPTHLKFSEEQGQLHVTKQ